MKLFILMLFFPVLLFAQAPNAPNIQQYKILKPLAVDYIPWQLSNQGCWGCASFYWKVTRRWDEKQYRFDLWFSSNSFYSNGVHASTYVGGIYLYVNGYLLHTEPVWLLFNDTYTNALLTFYYESPNPKVRLIWEQVILN